MLFHGKHQMPTPENHKDCLQKIIKAAIEAVSPHRAISNLVRRDGERLYVAGQWFDLPHYDRVRLLGAGKASAPMAKAFEDILGDALHDGLLVVKYGHGLELRRTRIMEAGHPVPDAAGQSGARALLRMAEDCTDKDLVFFLLSGGASALTPAPLPGVSLKDVQRMTQLLLDCGATIDETNALRKHVSQFKGGGLARALAPATTTALIVSDVVGDRLDVIGSGPTAPDASSFKDCLNIVARYGLGARMPREIMRIITEGVAGKQPETTKPGESCFNHVRNRIVASNHIALEQAAAMATSLGYQPMVLTSHLQGEAREVAKLMIAVLQDVCLGQGAIRAPACLLWGGETTVTIRGTGKGGRNQELALAAGLALEQAKACMGRVALACVGTDGGDGPTDAAGAMVLPGTMETARAKGADPAAHLENNDAYHFFEQAGTLVKTGPTLTNVMDVAMFLVSP